MTPIELKILMIRKKVKASDAARRLKITRQTVYKVRNGISRSRRVEDFIATGCGMRHEDIFPIIPEPLCARQDKAA